MSLIEIVRTIFHAIVMFPFIPWGPERILIDVGSLACAVIIALVWRSEKKEDKR